MIKDGGKEMKKNLLMTIALIGGLFLFATSCVKETNDNDQIRPIGGAIVFSAATGYDNGVETRTEYTGDMKTVTGYTNPFERIDWVANDQLTVYYRRGTGSFSNAGYKITGSNTVQNEITKASTVAIGDELLWADGSGAHKFYGMYPRNGFQGNNSAVLNENHVQGMIPAAQNITGTQKTQEGIAKYMPDMKYAYMVCYQELAEKSSDNTVTLPFRPAMTAFEFRFKLATGNSPVTVKSFKMTSASTDLTGNFAFDITGKDNTERATIGTVTKTNTGREITVSFGASGVQLNSTDILDFTVFALPVNQSGLTVEFTFAATETGAADYTQKLDLKHSGSWVTFDACKKYVITNSNVPGEVWDYFIDPIDDKVAYGHNPVTATNVFTYNVYSYKVKRGTTTKVPVPWHLEYQNGSSWTTTNPSSDFTAATTATGAGSNGTTFQSGYSTITTTATGTTTGDASDATRAALASATPRGTASDYFDLSMHPCYGNKDATTSQNTANCYIVSAPGYYKFPLVYGNAIKNGADNVISYAPESVTHIYQNYKNESHLIYQANFHNAINENITSPYILTDLGSYGTVSDLDVAIIWQDVPTGYEIIPYSNPTIEGTGSSAYIKFSITAEDIQQGNIVIALRGKVAGHLATKEILWSWHIWVTEKDLAPVTVYHAVNGSSEMAQYNLGWTDKTNAQSTKYTDRILNLRVVQNDGPNKTEEFTFKQIGDATYTPDNIGSNAFYQWGRKDPFLTAASANQNKSCSTGEGYTITSDNVHLVQQELPSSGDPDFGYGIRNPYKMIKNSYTSGWVGGPTHVGGTDAQRQNSSIAYNLWSAYVRGQHDKTNYGGAKAKTVYDPCPPGFEVPSKNAFMGFAGYTGTTEAPNTLGAWRGSAQNDGVQFYRNGASGATIYLPFCGARGYDRTEIYDVSITAYYWTDAPDKSDYAGTGDHNGWRMSKLLYFTRNAQDGEKINAHYDLYKGAAYAIRPVLESVQRVNTGVTTGGMDGNTYDFNDDWTINQ